MKKTILALAALTAAALVLGGCFRKHIESAPSARQPAQRTVTTPAPAQPVIEETHMVGEEKPMDGPMEEVYEVDAAKQAGAKTPSVGEADLAEEALPDADQLKREAEAAASKQAAPATERAASPAPEPDRTNPWADPEDEVVGIGSQPVAPDAEAAQTATGPYFVQVGAFSDVENANRALARLIEDGYKGSVIVKTNEGLYRVQAGSFPDEASAGSALEILKADYPKGFVLKKP
ncbi:SPOR domain-containing protein [Pseudodesulfovibrio thermohalotolerans]|uniref:SPOR domain-containing protein n=1 Tax=Pseudodesulfovibrio thermohalotolerans TaxID=2880651 RepID=UPI0024411208|nr:SPOR domain-containing protein [Pseudodesulfovibrio thermohalotolerans]WFS62913.1 SPOR domain-containing protein [Pseudodesulfovibrio thermohalotolerans]